MRIFSTIALRPLAPVFWLIAMLAISSIASSVKVKSTSSILKEAWNCFVMAFFGCVRMETRSSFVSSFKATVIGIRPISSGIRPNFTRSSGQAWFSRVMRCSSVIEPTFEPNPIACSAVRCSIIFSSPTKAPPKINRMFVVSISIISWFGCFLPPWGGTLAFVPSIILSKACWTPSPETSRVIEVFSLFLEILSISSIKIIPRSAAVTSPSAAFISFNSTFSTSSPT